jgi:hypothetical protein
MRFLEEEEEEEADAVCSSSNAAILHLVPSDFGNFPRSWRGARTQILIR